MGCRQLSIKNENDYTPMLFTLETERRLSIEKKHEMLEFCELFNIKYDLQALKKYFNI